MERPVLGILVNVNSILDNYQLTLWQGVRDAVREVGASLVSFSGGVLESPYGFESQNNIIYDQVGAANVDALVILTASICNYAGERGVASLRERFAGIPQVHIGLDGGRGCSLVIDNISGVREAMDHLVKFHGRKRIAHISGMETNPEAQARLEAYRTSLQRNGIPYDPDLVVNGDFRKDRGYDAIGELLDNRKVAFDAIFSANDAMALGALQALKERGISVPHQVALVGFDDLAEASHSTPPLTTVRQPLYVQGRRAAQLALRLVAGEVLPPIEALPAELVLRQSCGCSEVLVEVCGEEDYLAPMLAEEVLAVVLERPGRLAGEESHRFAREMLAASGLETSRFLEFMQRWFLSSGSERATPDEWCEAVAVLRRSVALEDRPGMEIRFRQALVAATAAGERLQSALRREADLNHHEQRNIGQAMLATMDLDEIVRLIGVEFRRLKIRRFWMCFHVDPGKPNGMVRLVCGYDENGDIDPELMAPFPAKQIVPEGIRNLPSGCQILVEALFHREMQIGYLAFERPSEYETGPILLREHLASAIRGALLVRQKDERAQELALALETLHRNQEQLMQQEKMATLGRMTAGIAHEMNTPLSALRSAVSEAHRVALEYDQSIGDPEVTSEDHHEISKELLRALDLANRAGEKAASYVQGIKTQTRDIGSVERQVFDLRAPLREAVLLLGFALRQADCDLILELPEGECLFEGNAGHVQQIVTNLVNNALDAMEGREAKRIVVQLESTKAGYFLQVEDNGCGIPLEHQPKIFEMLFTTKAFGHGTGLGLSIVQNVVGGLGGSIDLKSWPGRGTRFEIRFPGGN